jgi:hypothetical protein
MFAVVQLESVHCELPSDGADDHDLCGLVKLKHDVDAPSSLLLACVFLPCTRGASSSRARR